MYKTRIETRICNMNKLRKIINKVIKMTQRNHLLMRGQEGRVKRREYHLERKHRFFNIFLLNLSRQFTISNRKRAGLSLFLQGEASHSLTVREGETKRCSTFNHHNYKK